MNKMLRAKTCANMRAYQPSTAAEVSGEFACRKSRNVNRICLRMVKREGKGSLCLCPSEDREGGWEQASHWYDVD
jgi:hypothetical protein